MLENRKNYAPEAEEVSYGYASDEVKQNPFNFGLNAGVTYLSKFEWIPNGGKEGAEQEALDIIFVINGTEKSYRQFPVTKAFLKDGGETTDPKDPAFIEAVKDFNAKMTHILHCFTDTITIQHAFSRPIMDTAGASKFKQYCAIAQTLLPKNFRDKKLDIFLQYSWNIREGQKKTYLEIPGKMKYGKWLCPAVEGTWEEIRVENPTETTKEALRYGKAETAMINAETGAKKYTEFHPFVKNGWFMLSNFAVQQKTEAEEGQADEAGDSQGASGELPNQQAVTTEGGAVAGW